MKKNRLIIIALIALSAILVTSAFTKLESDSTSSSAAASITIAELQDHLAFLASDELFGREPGNGGYQAAAEYAVTQFRASGLEPLMKDENGNLSYYQTFYLDRQKKSDNTTMVISKDGETKEFSFGKDFTFLSTGSGQALNISGAKVVYAGYGIQEPNSGWDDFEGLDVKGKYVLVKNGVPTKDGESILPEKIEARYKNRRGGMMARLATMRKLEIAGLISLPSDDDPDAFERLIGMFSRPRMSLAGQASRSGRMSFITMPFVLAGKSVSDWLFEEADDSPGAITIDLVAENVTDKVATHNIVAYLPGTDENLRNEYITIGAHLDHVGISGGMVFNGADDNASGSVAVLEAAEAVAITPPGRSVIFILYSSEELGLLGSKYFAGNSPVAMEDVIVNINMDMVGRDSDDFPQGVFAIGSTKRSKELKEILIATNESTVSMPLDFRYDEKDPENLWRRSDQFSFHEKGVPVVFFTSGLHPDYHRPSDDFEKINYEKVRNVARLCYEMAMSLGNRDERPKVD